MYKSKANKCLWEWCPDKKFGYDFWNHGADWEQTDQKSIKFLRKYILKETANLDLKSISLLKM